MADEDSYVALDSEDLQSAFNVFRRLLGPLLSFFHKVSGDALGPLGGSKHTKLHPLFSWLSWSGPGGHPDPGGDPPHRLHRRENHVAGAGRPAPMDGYEICRLKKELAEEAAGRPSRNHVEFIEACESLGLPRNEGKQLGGAFNGTLQGGEMLGKGKGPETRL